MNNHSQSLNIPFDIHNLDIIENRNFRTVWD